MESCDQFQALQYVTQQWATKMTEVLKPLSYDKRLRELALFSLGREGSEDLINVYEKLRAKCIDVSSLISVVPNDSTRGNGHKLKLRKFPEHRETLFYSEGDRALAQIAQRDSGDFYIGDI